jgi:hypothetical protein
MIAAQTTSEGEKRKRRWKKEKKRKPQEKTKKPGYSEARNSFRIACTEEEDMFMARKPKHTTVFRFLCVFGLFFNDFHTNIEHQQ